MFYSYELAVTAAHIASNKKEVEMDLSAGIIHQVDILFPDDCDHNIRVQIFDASFQLWPSNRNGTIRGDATIVSFRDFYELKSENNTLTAYAWWEDTETVQSIFVQVGLLPRAIMQPFSLAELLRAVQKGA